MMPAMGKDLVPFTTSSSPYLQFAIEETLKGAGIPYAIRDYGGPPKAFATGRLLFQEYLVPANRLQEAKDVLCANGIVCDVSERLLRRAIDEIVKPLMQESDRDLSRLARFIEVNNKETVKALFEQVLREEGGQQLLEDLFFQINRLEDLACLRTLARVLGPHADAAFNGRLMEVLATGSIQARLALIEVLPELPSTRSRAEAIAHALRDPQLEIRDAGAEAVFALGKGNFGYDPEGPEEERESAIDDFLAMFG